MAKIIAIVMGFVFILIGVIGFVSGNFLGTHLTLIHNLIHLASGALALYVGFKASPTAAKIFGFGFGAFYLLLGFVGYWLGLTHYEGLPPEVSQGINARMFRIIPGYLELGFMDHLLHFAIGAVFIIGAFLTRGNMTGYMEDTPE